MEKIVNWNKFDDYRLPTINEFTDDFEFEYISLVKTDPTISKDCKATTIYWTKTKGFKDLTVKRIKQMLETGYIRVMKVNESVNLKNNKMKLFYYPIDQRWYLTRNKETNEVEKYEHRLDESKSLEYVVIEANSANEGADMIYSTNSIDIPNKTNHKLLKFNDQEAYTIGIGKELLEPLSVEPHKIIILGNANTQCTKILPSIKTTKVQVEDEVGNKLLIEGVNGDVPVYQEKVKVDKSYKWKPTIKPEIHQPERSPNRLVWITNLKTSDVQRIPWIKATEITKANPDYTFTSKKEAKSLKRAYFLNKDGVTIQKCKIGKSFTAAKGDNGIYIERRKFPKSTSSTRNNIRIDKTIVENKDRTDLEVVNGVKGIYNHVIIDDGNISGKVVEFVPYTIIRKNGEPLLKHRKKITYSDKAIKVPTKDKLFVPVTTDLVITKKVIVPNQKKKEKRIKRHNGKFKNPHDLKEFVITITKHHPEGESAFIYTITAPNPTKAENRAWKRIDELGLDRAYFKAHSEEIIKSDILIPEKKDNRSNGVLTPKIVKLHTPLIKKDFDDKGQLVPKEIWEITKWFRQFSSIEVIKKIKTWKHPIKDFRIK